MKPLIALEAVKKIPTWAYWLAGAGVALYIIKKGGVQGAIAGATTGILGVIGNAVIGVAQGAAVAGIGITDSVANAGNTVGLGIRGALGFQPYNLTKCKQAIAIGDDGQAFTYCTAPVYARWQYLSIIKNLTNKTFTMSDIFN